MDASEFPGLIQKFEELHRQGLVEEKDGRYAPTLKGYLCGNEIYESLLDFFR